MAEKQNKKKQPEAENKEQAPEEKKAPAAEKKKAAPKAKESAGTKDSASPDAEKLAEQISSLEKELADLKDSHLRTLAEYDNYRKRTAKEKQATYGDAKADAIKEFLAVIDNFERALSTDASDGESFKKGMEMIYGGFMNVFEKLGCEAFGEAGETFDPNIHNGVMHIDSEEFGENVISAVFSKGYRLGERILRPAMVQVAN